MHKTGALFIDVLWNFALGVISTGVGTAGVI